MKATRKILALTTLLGSMAAAATVATVNGKAITSDEVNKVLMEGTQGRFDSLPKDKQDELRTRIIDGMITQELVYADAIKDGVLETQEYKEELAAVLERLKMQLAAKVWEQQQFDKVLVSEKETRAYYDQNAEEFLEKEKVHARHILVKTETKANELIAELKKYSGGALQGKFVELAKKESTGPSGPKGGDLGYFPQGQMVPEFNDAVFSMSVGTITTSPVKSQFGYHIIFLEDKKSGKKLSFDEVKGFIDQRLRIDKFKTVMDAKMTSLKENAKITYGE